MPEPVETSDVHAPSVLKAALAVVVVAAYAAGACWLLWRAWQPNGAAVPVDVPIAAPQLQTAPQDERAAYFAEQDQLLHRYQRLDRDEGTVRIPIEAAMAVIARREAARRERPEEERR